MNIQIPFEALLAENARRVANSRSMCKVVILFVVWLRGSQSSNMFWNSDDGSSINQSTRLVPSGLVLMYIL
jgi:hypothetical protein